jgi:anthranilate synthase component 1
MSYPINIGLSSLSADTLTPVSAYLKLRDLFPNTILLESSDHSGTEHSYSYICCHPFAGIRLQEGEVVKYLPCGSSIRSVADASSCQEIISSFIQSFHFQVTDKECCKGRFFGHINYDAVTYFEKISFRHRETAVTIPDVRLHIYQYVIVFDHFNHAVYLATQFMEGSEMPGSEMLEAALCNPHITSFRFDTVGEELADTSEEEYRDMVVNGKVHCRQGDVFQIVLSRSFAQPFKGDDFNVYRALRAVNPSPYLFYFDYGNYRLFGSSPETQLKVNKRSAVMHPIAGTCRRSGNEEEDALLIDKLVADPKENAEHTMLVDLARNDLSKSHDQVEVTFYKKVQQFSHVAHIVSEVTATQPHHSNAFQLIADTFPAGTLSGAPKYKAMQLIDRYEKTKRSYYGGSIGFLAPDGTLNMAIMIRSFMSNNNTLYYRAGAGITDSSIPENELQEVAHKLKGLRAAMAKAKEIKS